MFKLQMAALLMVLIGCSTAQCRKPAQINKDTATTADEKLLAGPGRVLVAKPDGSKQCQSPDSSTAKSLDAMKSDLKDIKVYDMAKQKDTLMRPQVCYTAPTGMHNVYEIGEEDLKKALSFGFVPWPLMKKGSYDDR